MSYHILPLLTEYFRMLIFYSQRLMIDVANSPLEDRMAFEENILQAMRHIRNQFHVEFKEWYQIMNQAEDSNQKDHVKSVEMIVRLLDRLRE